MLRVTYEIKFSFKITLYECNEVSEILFSSDGPTVYNLREKTNSTYTKGKKILHILVDQACFQRLHLFKVK